jgi:hypothetical protein
MTGTGPQITTVDNRPWYKKPLGIAGIVGGVVLVGVIASAGGGGDDNGSDKAADTASTAASTPSSAPTSKPTEKKPAPAPATWKNVVSLQGNTNKSSSDFHLNGCDTRLKYNVNGGSSTIVAFYVVESGKQLMKDGGFPAASPTESGPGETSLHEGKGDYYLDVMGANANWSATVQEKC